MTELAVLDFETTGLVPGQDEVLQVAVVDETGAVLMNEYCRPQRHTAWADAQKVNGIAPQDVCGKPPFEALVPRLQEILSGARRVVAYNDGFEKPSGCLRHSVPRLRWGRTQWPLLHSRWAGRSEAFPPSRRFSAMNSRRTTRWPTCGPRCIFTSGWRTAGCCAGQRAMRRPRGGSRPGPGSIPDAAARGHARLLKCLGCPLTAAQARQRWYKGIYTASPRPCEIVGFQNRSKEDGWLVVAVERTA
ncbi:MAG: exonuclease domain-containing protein [Ruthenibacterium lactatiformans]